MNPTAAGTETPIPLPMLRRVIDECDAFEADFRAGRPGRIERHLEGVPDPERSLLLCRLLGLEVELRRGRGEHPEPREYLERFPDEGRLVHDVFAAVSSSVLATGGEAGPGGDSSRPTAFHDHARDPVREAAGAPEVISRFRVIRLLGEGGFSRVYLAEDPGLGRTVAIKVPRTDALEPGLRTEMFLNEARVAAALTHPAIVTVYDAGCLATGEAYIVTEYIDGRTLAEELRAGPVVPPSRASEVIAGVAEAVHFAHTRGLVHRDLKPANILLDRDGRPHVADFGLAVHEEGRRGRPGEVAGTPAYMAPEQVRGEAHRLDGRTDVWALGVTLYQMLTGRRPFSGERVRVFDEILHRDPKPPRQVVDTIPEELERVCLKCLSKRMTDRYTTAADLARDLREWREGGSGRLTPGRSKAVPRPAGRKPERVVPKGLRSFDAGDAGYFLDLLPGPKDRHGLPECLRFWKARVEPTDPGEAFPVGLIYGPSGCGKSSLVRAGLLPRLAPHVRTVYIEATPDGTEARLSLAVRRAFPGLPEGADLVDLLAELREGRWLEPGRKVLLVLDQFEQWLHARRDEEDTELVAALRHCDGGRVQAVVLVRDDFWMAVTRLMRGLEVALVEGRNSAAVDLFDPPHARRVLTLFGRAFGALPEKDDDLTPDQRAFVEDSIAGLAQDGKVIPVRLALFAQMVKGESWSPGTLRAVGGARGVGVTFLEETFCAPTAPAKHRLLQAASRAVLAALLPENGTDIKGRIRPEGELRAASGCEGRPDDFDDLIRVLDGELRLITPTDPEGVGGDGGRDGPAGERYYQLTHDYLVPSLRDWMTRKRRETREGRAGLRLEELSAPWNAKPENRLLPTAWEWAGIRLQTRPADWTGPQRKMMRRAGQVYARKLLVLGVVLGLLAAAGLTTRRALIASGLVQQLLHAEIARVPESVAAMRDYRGWTDPKLRRLLDGTPDDPGRKLRVSLALLPDDPGQVGYLSGRLVAATTAELPVLRDALEPHGPALTPGLWAIAGGSGPDDPRVLAAAGALARFDPGSPRWDAAGGRVARALVGVNPVFLGAWVDALYPVRGRLKGPLAAILRDPGRPEGERSTAADILAEFAVDDAEALGDLVMDASPRGFTRLLPVAARHAARTAPIWEAELAKAPEPPGPGKGGGRDRDRQAGRRARAAVALLGVGRPAPVWPWLRHDPEPRIRSFLVNGFRPLGVDPGVVAAEFDRRIAALPKVHDGGAIPPEVVLFDPEVSGLRAVILAMGTYPPDAFPRADREARVGRLLDLYATDPDAGVHGAAEWCLRRWGEADRLARKDAGLRGAGPGGRRWLVGPQGQAFVAVGDGVDFDMGSPPDEPGRRPHEVFHRRVIPRRFAVATKEVSVEQYGEFLTQRGAAGRAADDDGRSPDPAGPRNAVSWYDAADYCNWLSRLEGLPEVYEPNDRGEYADGMRIKAGALRLTGYRLPTEAEWEYACRAGARTSRYYGDAPELLGAYAWNIDNSGDHAWPRGALIPNDLGLFDTLGNLLEWCQDRAVDYRPDADGRVVDEAPEAEVILDTHSRLLRGGSFTDRPDNSRSADRDRESPANRYMTYGFRPARTLPAVDRPAVNRAGPP